MTTTPEYSSLVERYIQLRDHITAREAAHKAEIAKFKEAQARIEKHLLAHLNTTGASSVSTAHGTFFKAERSSATVADWALALDYIKSNDLWNMLDKRVNKTAVKEFLEEHGDLPPGVDLRRELVVQIRRA